VTARQRPAEQWRFVDTKRRAPNRILRLGMRSNTGLQIFKYRGCHRRENFLLD